MDLECDSEYAYRLRTFRTIDSQFTPYSDIASDVTLECGLSQPTGFAATGQSEDTISLTWQNAPDEEGETIIETASEDGLWDEVARVPSGVGAFDLSGLFCDTSHSFRIREYVPSTGNYSQFTDAITASTMPCEMAPPSEVQASTIGQSQIEVTWSPTQEASIYIIERSEDGENWIETGSVSSGETSFVDTNLACETLYSFRLRAFQETRSQFSGFSDITATTTDNCGLEPPSDITALAVAQDRVDLRWEKSSTEDMVVAVERFNLDTGWEEIDRTRPGAVLYKDVDLHCSSSYSYRIRAVEAEGDAVSPYSDVITVDTFACTKESPTEVMASAVSQSEIDLQWVDDSIIETGSRELANFKTDENGDFSVTFTMPDVREHEEPQKLTVVEILDRQITGLSDTTTETFQLILVTILMALMASTLGSLTAIPISFLGARNIMANVGAPLASIMAGVIGLAAGGAIGLIVGRQISLLVDEVAGESIWFALIGAVAIAALALLIMRISPAAESNNSLLANFLRFILSLLVILLSFLAIGLLCAVGMTVGDWLNSHLGFLGFIGNFMAIISELLRVLIPILVAAVGGLLGLSVASRYGQESVLRLDPAPAKVVTAILAAAGTFIFVFGIIYVINFFCVLKVCHYFPDERTDLILRISTIAGVVGIIAGLLSLVADAKRPYPIGLVTYTVTRTTLNAMRAIEPVILGFTFVVWVGIGPFAGIMALMLNSIADLGKLFSEQVENISEGPVEAVTATGANRLQVIAYSVVPQVVPHFIAFIFYRWDINVRMSTIIGFVGGGGIGVVLFRYTNQTLYQKAAVMVIAIAVVVTLLDYISSRIRKRII
jgi:phosphonate ABC transporter permease subunit PhnE